MEQNQMRAIKLFGKCESQDLVPTLVNIPKVKKGYILIEVKAFSVNESEITSRKGESSSDFSFPRILGIEGVGTIKKVYQGSKFKVGQKVATMMGGLGRSIDGSYAEYMLVKEDNIIPFETNLSWGIVGSLPEMLQTAYGSLTQGLRIEKNETLLVRGGSSTVGLMSIILAKIKGATVIATSRKNEKMELLKYYGADYTILDDSNFEKNINNIVPNGIDKVLELVGGNALVQDISFVKKDGSLCFTGALSGQWVIDEFSPFMIPTGVFLTSYAGGSQDLPTGELNSILKQIEEGEIEAPIAKIYQGLEKVGEAQENLESGKYEGKHVIVL